jgi:hypothetical protein
LIKNGGGGLRVFSLVRGGSEVKCFITASLQHFKLTNGSTAYAKSGIVLKHICHCIIVPHRKQVIYNNIASSGKFQKPLRKSG